MFKKVPPVAGVNNKQVYKMCMAMNTMVQALGMQAENQARQFAGKGVMYTERDFQDLITENRMLPAHIVKDLMP